MVERDQMNSRVSLRIKRESGSVELTQLFDLISAMYSCMLFSVPSKHMTAGLPTESGWNVFHQRPSRIGEGRMRKSTYRLVRSQSDRNRLPS